MPFPLIDDGIAVRAPIAGVVAGLRVAPTEVAVFLPVDCPLMTPEALRSFADDCADAAVAETGPLPGAYVEDALPSSNNAWRRASRSGRGAHELDTRTVELDPELLANVNTERDLDRLRALAT